MRANHSSSILSQGMSAPVASESPPKLEMTSLVDMMVILVVFLLMSFSADEQIATSAAGLQLPASSSNSSVPRGLVVEVGLDNVIVDGRNILSTKELLDIVLKYIYIKLGHFWLRQESIMYVTKLLSIVPAVIILLFSKAM